MYKKMQKNVKKFRKKFNTKFVRAKQTYSREEIAELFHVNSNTVSVWLKAGLPKIDNQQPHFVFGQDLIDFLKARDGDRKHPCAPCKLFYFKCQQPSKPQGNVVCIKMTRARTNVMGFCEKCGTKINKAISPQQINLFQEIFTVREMLEENLLECASTCAISDKEQDINMAKFNAENERVKRQYFEWEKEANGKSNPTIILQTYMMLFTSMRSSQNLKVLNSSTKKMSWPLKNIFLKRMESDQWSG